MYYCSSCECLNIYEDGELVCIRNNRMHIGFDMDSLMKRCPKIKEEEDRYNEYRE